jgi:hypothetical protein
MRSSVLYCISLFVALVLSLHGAHAVAQSAPPPPPPVYAPQPYPPPVYAAPPPVYAQQVYVTQPQRPIGPRPKRGLMIAGVSTLAASYAVGLITGAALVETKCCENAGWSLFIPLAGPFMAAQRVDHARGALALLGAVQVIGAGLTIGGVVMYVMSQKQARAPGVAQFKLHEGRSLALDVSTTPYLTGPTMHLRF